MVKKKGDGVGGGQKMNRGAWTAEEDQKLVGYVRAHGDKKWRTLPVKAGLNRCGKSCRLRWLNYLRPGIKRGNISEDEEDLIMRLHNLLGNRWSIIAGRLPGRTDNEIKNHWHTHLSKRLLTIDDLNLKVCQNVDDQSHENTSQPSVPRELSQDDTASDPVSHTTEWFSNTTAEPVNMLTSDVSEFDFLIDDLFGFVSVPDLAQSDIGNNESELEGSDGTLRPDSSRLTQTSDDGSLNWLFGIVPSEFGPLDQLIGPEGSFSSNCTLPRSI